MIAFYLPAQTAPMALAHAGCAHAGLVLDPEGRAILYSGQVEPLLAFAAEALRTALG